MKKNMLTRIIVGVLLSAFFIAIWFAAGFMGRFEGPVRHIVQVVLFGLINVLCVDEMRVLFRAKNLKMLVVPSYIFAAVMPLLLDNLGLAATMSAAFICILITVTIRIFSKKMQNEDMFASLAVYAYPILPLGCLFTVCAGKTPEITQITMLMTFVCAILADSLAYFFGMFFGKRKLCEHISPKKTVAGSIGAIIGSALGGVLCYFMQPVNAMLFNIPKTEYSIYIILAFSLLLGIVSQIGDLFASCIKRWAGVKDYGHLFPGHGGALDRIDSELLCAPFILILFYIVL